MKYCIVYLASPQESKLSTGELRFDMLSSSISNTAKVFSGVDYIIFHEDLDESHQRQLSTLCPTSKTTFEKLDFVRSELDFKQFARPKGYMLMCRFFSGELQHYLISHDYDGYIRFDDDSFLLEPFVLKETLAHDIMNHGYTFRSLFIDGQPKYNNGKPMQSLYDFTKEFLISNGFQLEKLITILKSQKFLDTNGEYTGIAPYNNFHACHLRVWQHPVVAKYIKAITDVNGCLMHFWMDANIHAMIIFMICPLINISVKLNTEFGYRHNRHFSIMNSPGIVYKNNVSFFPK